MRKIKVVVLLVRQLQHGFTKNVNVSPSLTVALIHFDGLDGQTHFFYKGSSPILGGRDLKAELNSGSFCG